MSQPHTLQHISSEFYVSKLADRRGRSSWEKDKKGILENAHDKVTHILKEHQVEPLPPDVERKIKEIARGQ